MRPSGPGRLAPTVVVAAVAALPGLAQADIECRFETECLGDLAKLETASVPGKIFARGGFPGYRTATEAGREEICGAAAGPALAAVWSSRSGFHMLSFDARRVAHQSSHHSANLAVAPLSVQCPGTCRTR